MRRFCYALLSSLVVPPVVWFGLNYDSSMLGWSWLLMYPGYLVSFFYFPEVALYSETSLQDLFLPATIFHVGINLFIIYEFSWPKPILTLSINPRKEVSKK